MVTKKKMAQATTVATSQQYYKAVFTALLAVAIYMVFTSIALAGDSDTPMGSIVCKVAEFVIYGNLGKGLATIGIITLGVGALLGKTSWGMAIIVGVGIATIFGAPSVLNAMGYGTCD